MGSEIAITVLPATPWGEGTPKDAAAAGRQDELFKHVNTPGNGMIITIQVCKLIAYLVRWYT
jgi:hypothetical protein